MQNSYHQLPQNIDDTFTDSDNKFLSKNSLDSSTENEKDLAQITNQVGTILSSDSSHDSASLLARQTLSSAATLELESLFGQYGNVNVQLAVDENYSIKDSKYDLLLPLYDDEQNIWFMQNSFHRTDNRYQGNLGFGYRTFLDPETIIGANVFYDHDFTNNHTRLGLGSEYWSNYAKFSLNGYLGLSNWKSSPDVVDYLERPASGFDVSAKSWLPFYPQIGGELKFEQYFGDEVALFGVDQPRQKNPYGLTCGSSYTPVTLFTLSAEVTQGRSRVNDSKFKLDLNYKIGVPLHKQLSSSGVSESRKLSNSRYDFVNRNNNIVLQYKKENILQLTTAKTVIGYPGERKYLGVVLHNKYPLLNIVWDIPAQFTAALGQFVNLGSNNYEIVLPKWDESTQNSYLITGRAYDIKKHASEPSTTKVLVNAPNISEINSYWTPSTIEVNTDAETIKKVVLTLNDNDGNLLDISASDITLSYTPSNLSNSDYALTRISAGRYELSLQSVDYSSTSFTITPTVQMVELTSVLETVKLSSIVPVMSQSTMTVNPAIIFADGPIPSVWQGILVNDQGDVITGVADMLSLDITAANSTKSKISKTIETQTNPIADKIVESSTPGTYTANITAGAVAGSYIITSKYSFDGAKMLT